MIDIPAIKARLSDPREVARLLGLRVMGPQARGVMVACPIHGNKSGSMSLRNDGNIVRAHCFGCGFHGDIVDLLGAIERDPRRGLARAAELAGGAVPMARVEVVQDERLPAEVYHELAARILEAGRLDGRPWVREVEAYLEERRLLEFAQADGWACLPGLKWLLQIAEEVCDGLSASGDGCKSDGNSATVDEKVRASLANEGSHISASKEGIARGYCVGVGRYSDLQSLENITPHALLIRAKLAQYNKRGEFVPTWGRWRLVIPWRGPDGRISALQRRRTWKHVPRDANDPEPAKYVLPWLPDWPYGSERIGGFDEHQTRFVGHTSEQLAGSGAAPQRCGESGNGRQADQKRVLSGQGNGVVRGGEPIEQIHRHHSGRRIAIVEGAVDVLAMRAMHPGFVVLGIPGINNWRSSWASLVAGADVRYALDGGKPRKSDGLISEDIACARIALDVAQAAWHGSIIRAKDVGAGHEAQPRGSLFAFPFTDRTVDWLLSRYRRGRSLFCVLCGAPEPWLCRGCGRRRAPVGMDWGEVWRSAR